jgi:hypothetical protein
MAYPSTKDDFVAPIPTDAIGAARAQSAELVTQLQVAVRALEDVLGIPNQETDATAVERRVRRRHRSADDYGSLYFGTDVTGIGAETNRSTMQFAADDAKEGGTLHWPGGGTVGLTTTIRLLGDNRHYAGPIAAYSPSPKGCVFFPHSTWAKPSGHNAGRAGLFETDSYYDGAGGSSVPDRGFGVTGLHMQGFGTAGPLGVGEALNGLTYFPDRGTVQFCFIDGFTGRGHWNPDKRADNSNAPANRVGSRFLHSRVLGCGNNATLGYQYAVDFEDTELTDGVMIDVKASGGKGFHLYTSGGWVWMALHVDHVQRDAIVVDNCGFNFRVTDYLIDTYGKEATVGPYYGFKIMNMDGGPPSGNNLAGTAVLKGGVIRHDRALDSFLDGGTYVDYYFRGGSGSGYVSLGESASAGGDQARGVNIFTLTTSVDNATPSFVGTALVDMGAAVPFGAGWFDNEQVSVTAAPGGVGAGKTWTVARGAHGTTPAAHTQPISVKKLLNISNHAVFDTANVRVVLGTFAEDNHNRIFAANSNKVFYGREVSFAHRTKALPTPVEGYWAQGMDIYIDDAVGGDAPAYRCVAGATPGTWNAYAALVP